MNQLNQVIVEGNVVSQPEIREIRNGRHVCVIPIAVNRTYKTSDGEFAKEVSFFDIDTFGKFADLCAKLCPKGRGIRVVGRLKQDRWQSEEGKNHSRVKIVADHVEFKPMFKKINGNDTSVVEGPESVDAGESSPTKKQKLAMLAEAAAAAQSEQEAGEIAF